MHDRSHQQLINYEELKSTLINTYKFLKWPAVILLSALIISPRFWTYWSNLDINFNHKIILDYISLVRWPLVSLVGILVLRPHLPALVNRIRKFGAGGAYAELDPPGNQELSSEDVAKLKHNVENTEVAESTDLEPTLEEQLTSPQAKIAFEQIYTEIFGTQIIILKRLATQIPDGLTAGDLEDIYQAHISSTNTPYPSFHAFIQYLLDNILVLYDPVDKQYKLTNAGVYFLRYLSERGVYERFKPF